MEMVKITGPGKVLEGNPADMERSDSAALGRISPSGASSPATLPTPLQGIAWKDPKKTIPRTL